MTEADHDSNPTSSTSGAAPAAPVKRPRGRPRKNPLPTEGGSSAPAAPRTPRAKPAAAVPRDRPSEWTIPRPGAAEAVAPSSSVPRAAFVKPVDEDTVRHPADEISEDDIRARREAAKAFVEDIGRLKTDMKAVDSYIAAPPPAPAAAAPADRRPVEFPDRPLSRNDYILQRRLQNPAKRMNGNGGGFPQGPYAGPRPSAPPFAEGQQPRHMNRRERQRMNQRQRFVPEQPGFAPPAPAADLPAQRMSELQRLEPAELLAMAEQQGIIETLASHARHDIVFALLRNHAARGGAVIGEGVLEIGPEGHGYLRNPWASYQTCPEDPMVPQQVVRRFGLRPGDAVEGATRPPSRDQRERRFVITDVVSVNGVEPSESRRAPLFESLVPTYPERRIRLETTREETEMRVAELVAPIGFGQRGLIVSPPRAGKTIILQKIANAISDNHPEAELVILLIDERPEEVTDMKRNTKARVFSSTFDDGPERHVQVAEVVLEIARRKVERGRDVVILLDSLTRLARAYNAVQPNGGKMLSGGIDANALTRPKRFFGSARSFEGGGSLTIIASAIVDTGSRLDEVVFEEFKGTGNMELCLDRQIAERRVFPAISIERSGTRKEELLMSAEEMEKVRQLRKTLIGLPPAEAVELLVRRIKDSATNADFLAAFKG